ncbi:hypothetical protein WJX72_002186 [[Myrmecia] bisecta]|uniref:Peptidase C14 caspase domain-containing protein n=1 Tax=[Myrmecia] bisecta TaxID=41462 RepID=A0AAW1P4G7_9CHLO
MAKRALLVGCNYPGSDAALKGCINDVKSMESLLTTVFKFNPQDIVIMIDTDPSKPKPTGVNIKNELTRLVGLTKPGDTMVFHFSGHGTQLPSDNPKELDGKDEAIVPCDMNVILDDDLRNIFSKLPVDAHFAMVADCCHSGTMLDHTEVQITGNKDGSPDLPAGLALPAALGSIFGLKELPAGGITVDGQDFKNRSLPVDTLSKLLSSLLGTNVQPGNLRESLTRGFGPDASIKAKAYIGYLTQIHKEMKAEGKQPGCDIKTLMDVVKRLFKKASHKPSGVPQGAGTAPGAGAYGNAPVGGAAGGGGAGGMGGISLQSILAGIIPAGVAAKPGSKPPPDAQLNPDVGVLISGCRDRETSADACPTGDPAQAYGALTNALTTVVNQHYKASPGQPITYMQVVAGVRELLGKSGFKQNPCLECSQGNAMRPFIGA